MIVKEREEISDEALLAGMDEFFDYDPEVGVSETVRRIYLAVRDRVQRDQEIRKEQRRNH